MNELDGAVYITIKEPSTPGDMWVIEIADEWCTKATFKACVEPCVHQEPNKKPIGKIVAHGQSLSISGD